MTRFAFALIASAVPCGVAFGQTYPQPPNFGARQPQQPLSPYLNLFSGVNGNPAVNYYNLTRPFTQSMSPFAAPPGMLPMGMMPQQSGFLPPGQLPAYLAGTPADPNSSNVPLGPTGHPVGFGNRFSGTGTGVPGGGGFSPTGQPGQSQPPRPGQTPATPIPRAKK